MITPSHPEPPDGCPFFFIQPGTGRLIFSRSAQTDDGADLFDQVYMDEADPAERFDAGSSAYVWMLRNRDAYFNDQLYRKLAESWRHYAEMAGDEMEGKTKPDSQVICERIRRLLSEIGPARAEMEAGNESDVR